MYLPTFVLNARPTRPATPHPSSTTKLSRRKIPFLKKMFSTDDTHSANRGVTAHTTIQSTSALILWRTASSLVVSHIPAPVVPASRLEVSKPGLCWMTNVLLPTTTSISFALGSIMPKLRDIEAFEKTKNVSGEKPRHQFHSRRRNLSTRTFVRVYNFGSNIFEKGVH